MRTQQRLESQRGAVSHPCMKGVPSVNVKKKFHSPNMDGGIISEGKDEEIGE